MNNIDQIKLATNIEFFARQVVEGFITGKHKSPYHGFSVEFADISCTTPEKVQGILIGNYMQDQISYL